MKIEIKNLTKSYNDTPVLDKINMTLSSDRPTCLMGQSGRGKTTLFSVLLGLIKPDSGAILGIENKKFSAVFQEDRLCEELSAVMNLAIVQENPNKKLISDGLMQLRLSEDEIHRPVSSLSGGQKRRVAIMRAIISESDIILMDEPFKGLDETTKIQVINYIKQNLRGRLLMVITHDEDDAKLLDAEIIKL